MTVNETVTGLINGMRGDSATMRLIRDYAMAKSAVAQLKPPTRYTSPVVRGIAPTGRLTAQAVAEGANKLVASGVTTAYQFQVFPVAIIVPVSNASYQSAEGVKESVIKTLTDAIAVGIDNEILNNPNSIFGANAGVIARAAAAGNNLTSTAYLYNDLVRLRTAVSSTYFEQDGVIARRSEQGALALAVPSGGLQ